MHGCCGLGNSWQVRDMLLFVVITYFKMYTRKMKGCQIQRDFASVSYSTSLYFMYYIENEGCLLYLSSIGFVILITYFCIAEYLIIKQETYKGPCLLLNALLSNSRK